MEAQADFRPHIVLSHPLPDWAVTDIRDEYVLHLFDPGCAVCRAATVMVTSGPMRLDAEICDHLPALRYIAAVGSGCEGIDAAYTRRRGIIVSNSAHATAADVADQAVTLALALHAGLVRLDGEIRAGRWPRPVRRSLAELNVGIVGLGAIGIAVARRLEPFGPAIRWTGPRRKDADWSYVSDLGDLAAWADMLIIAARADASNVGMIDAAVIERLGPGGLIVNVSRGSIIDEDAMIAALAAGRLGGAGLDVFRQEPTPGDRWRNLPNVILSPHIGGLTTGVRAGIARLLSANIRAFLAGGMPVGLLAPVSHGN